MYYTVIIINVICTEDVGDKRMMAIDIALHCYVRHELLEHLNRKHVLAGRQMVCLDTKIVWSPVQSIYVMLGIALASFGLQ